MEVGIEDCLHIEFEYDKSKYHLKDTVVGKIYFLLVRLLLLPCTAGLKMTCYKGADAVYEGSLTEPAQLLEALWESCSCSGLTLVA